MTTGDRLLPSPERRERPEPSYDLRFAIDFGLDAGIYMAERRRQAKKSGKLDGTDVTDIDEEINRNFIAKVQARPGKRASVRGEEASHKEDSEDIWVIDPIDGTSEYLDNSLTDEERTSCIGLALLKRGRLQLSVAYNPFRDELFVADRDLHGAFLNGKRLDLRAGSAGQLPFAPGVPYDFSYFEEASVDTRLLVDMLGPPLNHYAAIYQACMVARGKSAFCVFPGNTIHDIAPAALLVELAGGTVTDTDGQPLDWDNLHDVVHSNGVAHSAIIRAFTRC